MPLLTRTYTFTDNTTAYGSQVETEISNIVTTLNNLDSDVSKWTNVDVSTAFKFNGNTILTIQQIVTGNTASAASTTSNSFAATNLSASITPKSTSSKILIIASGALQVSGTGGDALATLARGGSNLLSGSNALSILLPSSNSTIRAPCTMVFLDSPASTSSLTYAPLIRNDGGGVTVQGFCTSGGETSEIFLVEFL